MRESLYTPLVSLVVPFYNEGEAVERFFDVVIPLMAGLDAIRFEIVCVNDGSRDDTLERLIRISMSDRRVRVIDLTRNFGKEAALTAGLDEAAGDAVIPLDADLQDPPSLIPVMLEHWRDGVEVVAAKRSNRACDSFAKRTAASIYYRVHNLLSDVKLPENVGDFRLMDRKVVNALRSLPERHRFMKGLFAWVGFRTTVVTFDVAPRYAGKSQFNLWKRWNFALEGITSFSTAPIRIWFYIGSVIAALSILYGIYEVVKTIVYGIDVPGYASLIVVLLLSCGIQLIGLGLIGEYVGRIFVESKQRPIYVIRSRYSLRKTSSGPRAQTIP